MILLLDKNTLTVGDILDFIDEYNIDENKRVMFDFGDTVSTITTLGVHGDSYKKIITFTANKHNTDDNYSFTIKYFLKHTKGFKLETPIAYLDIDYVNTECKQDMALRGVLIGYRCVETGNLILKTSAN